jgi:hypothetical protein
MIIFNYPSKKELTANAVVTMENNIIKGVK